MNALRLLLLLAVSGCHAPSGSECGSVEATVDEAVTTRVRVAWSSRAAGEAWVEFGAGLSTPTIDDGGTDHEAVLVGVGPLTDVAYTTHVRSDAGEEVCEGTIRTGNLPAGLPSITVESFFPEYVAGQYILAPLRGETGSALVLLDRGGEIVWYRMAATNEGSIDVEWDPARARMSWNIFDVQRESPAGRIDEGDLLNDAVTSWDTTYAHHAFAVLPDGYAYLQLDPREWTDPDSGEVVLVGGDAIAEVGFDGATRTAWSTWDDLEVESHPGWENGLYAGIYDWTHASGLSLSPDGFTYLMSSASLDLVIEVDRGGNVLRTIGRGGTYRVEPGTAEIKAPHGPVLTEEHTLLVYGHESGAGQAAGAREFTLDTDQNVAALLWEYGFDTGLSSLSLGQAIRQRNGNTLVNFGSAGALHDVSRGGALLWSAETSLGWSFGNVAIVDTPYPLREPVPAP